MPDDTTRTSNRRLNSGASEYNAISFLVEQQMKGQINTAIPVRVDSCTKPGPGGAAGYVSATPLVMQRGADGNSLAPVSLPKLPFFRLYAGTAAVVIDPQPGDVGLAIFSQQDASNLEAGKNDPVQAGSFRAFDMSDGFYIGGFLGNVPDVFAELEQEKGITLRTPSNVITIDRDGGNITITANSNVTVQAPVAVVDSPSTTMTGNVAIGGTLTTGGLATFQQGLQTTGGSSAFISGNVSAGGNVSADGDFSGGGGLSLGGGASIGGTLDAVGAATFGSTLETTGAASFRSTLEATGAATFGSSITASGAITGQSLSTGAISASTITASGALSAYSISTGDINAGAITADSINSTGTLSIGGDISVAGTITADNISAGDISASGTISGNISGSGSIIGDLNVSGAILASGDLTAANINIKDLTATGTANIVSLKTSNIESRLTSPEYIRLGGAVGITQTLAVDGDIRSEGSITAPTIREDPPTP